LFSFCLLGALCVFVVMTMNSRQQEHVRERLSRRCLNSPQRHKEHKEKTARTMQKRFFVLFVFLSSWCSLCLCGDDYEFTAATARP
jgi:hypothetical protein